MELQAKSTVNSPLGERGIMEEYWHERQHNLAQDSYLFIQLGTANPFSCYCQIQNNSWLLIQRWLKVTVCSGTRRMCKVSCESRHSPCSLECLETLPGDSGQQNCKSPPRSAPSVFQKLSPDASNHIRMILCIYILASQAQVHIQGVKNYTNCPFWRFINSSFHRTEDQSLFSL